jgi:hypothetical protein
MEAIKSNYSIGRGVEASLDEFKLQAKGHFILWSLVERTKDSKNLIGA